VAGLLACLPLFFGQAVLLRQFFFLDDIFVHFYPHWAYTGRHLGQGTVPLWCPEIFCGFPIASNPQFGPWYLPHWVCFALFSAPVAINLVILGHYALAALGAFLFARSIGLSACGAFVAAVGYSFSGFLLTYHVAPQGLLTLSWVPAILWQLEISLAPGGRKLLHASVAGLMLGMLLLSGHIQIAMYEFLLIAGYGVFRIVQLRQWRSLFLLGWHFVLGFGLSAVQLLPALELFGQAARSGAADRAVQLQEQSYLGLEQLVEMVVPNFFGGMLTDEGFFYPSFVGVPVVFLAVLALLRRPKGLTWFFLCGTAASIVLAAGPNTPLYDVLHAAFPAVKVFKSPVRAMGVAIFCLSMLAGLGCSRQADERLRWRSLLVPLLLGVLLAGGLFLKWRQDEESLKRLAVPAQLQGLPDEGLDWTLKRRPAELAGFCVLLALMFTGCLRARDRRIWLAPPGTWQAVCALLGLWVFSRDVVGLADRAIYDYRSSLLEVIEHDTERGRVFHIDTEDDFLDLTKLKWEGWPMRRGKDFTRASETLRENLSQAYGFEDFFGFSSLPLARYQKFRYGGQEVDPIYAAYQVDVLPPFHLLERADCRYFVVGRPWPRAEQLGPLVRRTPQYCVYRTKSCGPRVYVTDTVRCVGSSEDALERLLGGSGRLAPVVEVGGPEVPDEWRSLAAQGSGSGSPELVFTDLVGMFERSPNHVRLAVSGTRDGAVILADAYYPGWSAWVDGHARHVYPADYLFRAVCRKGGEGEVVFAYAPFSVKLGVFAFMIHASAFVAAIILAFRRPRGRETGEANLLHYNDLQRPVRRR
jgi:hypothetical protein